MTAPTSEMVKTYYEVQEYFDKMDVLDTVNYMTEQQVEDAYNITKDEFISLSETMAQWMRHDIENYDDFWIDARDCAIREVISDYLHRKERENTCST